MRGERFRSGMRNGMAGIYDEINVMISYVRHFSGDPGVVEQARAVVMSCPVRDQKCEALAIHEFVRDRVRFVPDPTDKEVIATPALMLENIRSQGRTSGDCDEISTLEASLLSAVGIPARFRFGGEGLELTHVWVQAEVEGTWFDLESTGYLEAGYYYDFPRYAVRAIF